MRIDSHRLSLLTAKEIDELYGLPHFTEADRHHYFALSVPERAAVDAHTTSVAVHLTLHLGYCKATWQVFSYEQDAVSDDLRYILARYCPGKTFADIQKPSRPTRLALQQIVLKLFDSHLCDSAANDELERKAQRNARLATQPIYLLREALQHLTTQRMVAPP